MAGGTKVAFNRKTGSAKVWQVAQRLLSTVTPLSEY